MSDAQENGLNQAGEQVGSAPVTSAEDTRLKRLNDRLLDLQEQMRKTQDAIKKEQANQRKQLEGELKKAKKAWLAKLSKEMLPFYPMPVDEIVRTIKASTINPEE